MLPTPTSGLPTPTATPNATVAFELFKAGFPPEAASDPIVLAAATEMAQRRAHFETATALTPSPTTGPTEPPAPTPTIGFGLIADGGCIPPFYSSGPRFPSCWHVQVRGIWLLVAAGSIGSDQDRVDDPTISVLMTCPEPCDASPEHTTLYPTPHNVKEARITAIEGLLVTVVARDPTFPDTFVFDLGTRQWVGLTPGPSPSP